ncbi:bactofilin family protein [Kushneria aurantia]|uniref:Polymer-forming cytoskeletal protein n=1 Tax=Kushneria aurantia TaxID=504092 RepID=A0ABV6G327_9GAMM|nr:polymer-forming cytoskeletal protein [Kushneria aurantia]
MFQKSASEANRPRSTASSNVEPLPHTAGDAASRGSLIGSATRVVGDIIGDEDLRIEGQVEGNVWCRDCSVSIGPEGQVLGDLYAETLAVAGHVKGRLIAARRITIHAGADVEGELHTPGLILEEGAAFHGSVDMNEDNPLLDEVAEHKHRIAESDEPDVTSAARNTADRDDTQEEVDERRD